MYLLYYWQLPRTARTRESKVRQKASPRGDHRCLSGERHGEREKKGKGNERAIRIERESRVQEEEESDDDDVEEEEQRM